jgi:hypothetical protein
LAFGESQVFRARFQRDGEKGAMALMIRPFVDRLEGAAEFQTQLFENLATGASLGILPRLQVPAEDGPMVRPDDVRLIVSVLHEHAIAGIQQHTGYPDQLYAHATPTSSPSDRR